jgi:hypothetical protein
MQSGLNFVGVQLWWEIRSKEIHVENWVQDKERRNVELKIIIIHRLGNGL